MPNDRPSTQMFVCTPITATSSMPRCSSALKNSCPSSVTTSFGRISINGVWRVQARNPSLQGSGEWQAHGPGSVNVAGSVCSSSGSQSFQPMAKSASTCGASAARFRAAVPRSKSVQSEGACTMSAPSSRIFARTSFHARRHVGDATRGRDAVVRIPHVRRRRHRRARCRTHGAGLPSCSQSGAGRARSTMRRVAMAQRFLWLQPRSARIASSLATRSAGTRHAPAVVTAMAGEPRRTPPDRGGSPYIEDRPVAASFRRRAQPRGRVRRR